MSATIIDRAYLEIDGVQIACDSIDENLNPSVSVVPAMTRNNRALGHCQGNPVFSLSAEVPMDADFEDLDFYEMAAAKTEFSATIEYEGGSSRTYTGCVIDSVDTKSAHGKHVSYSLKISAIDCAF